MPLLKRSAAVAFVAPLTMFVASCQQPPPPPPPLPPLTESCKFTNTPVVAIPSDRAVERISAGRRGTEPSLISVAVRIGDDFRQDGTMYVPGPDLGYHAYLTSSGVLRAKRRQQCTEACDGFDALELCRCLLRPGARVLNALSRCRWRHDSVLYGAYSATEHCP